MDMSNTNANFEMTGALLGQEVRKRKNYWEEIVIIQQVRYGICMRTTWEKTVGQLAQILRGLMDNFTPLR